MVEWWEGSLKQVLPDPKAVSSRVSQPRGAPSARDDTVSWSGEMFLKDWITARRP
jgi:hypothetical protein